MITPSKFISFKHSIIGKISFLRVAKKEIGIHELYDSVAEKFDGIDEFIYALDVLYALNKIKIDFTKGIVIYAD